MKLISFLLIAINLISFSSKLFAEIQTPIVDLNNMKTIPSLPALTKGCEGECCGILKTNKALTEIQLYESPDKLSKKIIILKKGEKFENADFFTKVLKFGEVVEEGKNLIVITYLSEGMLSVWDGKAIRATDSGENYQGPQTESWVQIKTKSVKGWANIPAKDSKELDYGWCG